MNLLTTVLIVFVVLLLLYYIIDWTTGSSIKLTHIKSAMKPQQHNAKKIKKNHSSNFTFSIWFYVDNWDVNLGSDKCLFDIIGASGARSGNPLSVHFDKNINNMNIKIDCYKGSKHQHDTQTDNDSESSDVLSSTSSSTTNHQCNIENFPLQKWVNLIISVEGRTMDVYLDGKLVKTCVLPGPANMSNVGGIVVTDPGFSGMTADLTYRSTASNPQQAYNIYASGFGGLGSNFFNKYKIRIAFLEDNKEQGHFDI